MSEKPLHNFEFPNDLKWNTERVYSRRRTQTTSPSPICHSSRLKPISERAHAPFELSMEEEDALGGLESMECPLIEYYNKNVVSIGKVDVEIVEKKGDVEGADVVMKRKDNVRSEEGSDVVKKTTKKEGNVKLTVNVALTPSEIKEDFYALGHKMSRKVKKRPKHIQNIIDGLCPGNNLVNISEDTYYVSANSKKKQG